jgi:hypothetical protein
VALTKALLPNPSLGAEVGAAAFLVPSSVSGSGQGRVELFFFHLVAVVVAAEQVWAFQPPFGASAAAMESAAASRRRRAYR